MDVESAYLHPKIKEDIYLEQTQGFEKLEETQKKRVFRLNKSIYGLKQATKNWYEEWPHSSYHKTLEGAKTTITKIENNQKLFVLS